MTVQHASPSAQREDLHPPVYAPVRTLMLYLTENCNLRCTYCFVDKKARHMSSETARRAVDFFLDRNVSGSLYNIGITFFGGEPFTRLGRMQEVVEYARKPRTNVFKDVAFSATTNGTIASPRAEAIIREARMSLLISMDGGEHSSTYRPFLSGRSSYEHLSRNLPRLVSWSPDVVVRMTYHPGSLDFRANIGRALELGAPRVALCPVLDTEWTGHEEALEEAHQTLADWYIAEAKQERILPLEVTNMMLRQQHHHEHGGQLPERPCGVATTLIGVDPDGHVMPCHRFLYRAQDRLGHVTDDVLSEARWRYVHLSSSRISGCAECMARPVCGGGCRAVALNAGYSLYEPHPNYCLTTRSHARAVRRIYDTLMADRCSAFIQSLNSRPAHNVALAELALR